MRCSDYLGSVVGVIDPTSMEVVADNVIGSGSVDPHLLTALSGDLALPGNYPADDGAALIDRYPNGVVTFLNPTDMSVRAQLKVIGDFAANPQDLLYVGASRAYLTRLDPNPDPDRAPLDEGNDILIIDTAKPEIIGRIDLLPYAGGGLYPRPGRMLKRVGSAWVLLAELSLDYMHGEFSQAAEVDIAADAVKRTIVLDGFENCLDLCSPAGSDTIYAVCSGVYGEGTSEQVRNSGIVSFKPEGAPEVSPVLKAAAVGSGRPFAATLACSAAGLWFAAVGDLNDGSADELYFLPYEGQQPQRIFTAAGAFQINDILADDFHNAVYVAAADPVHPLVHVFDARDRSEIKNFNPDPSVGLPPRDLAFY